ncbi:hypothetical protein [Halomonas sp. TA6]|uniref:hypothetical protein n=1 Tax=Halomonas sp. TA6 TaxID=2730854 RepID=UPI0020B75176|nr:hypothetical protein [Halomonas sp. TA6]
MTHQHQATGVALRPALERGDAVGGGHRLAIVPGEPVAQGEGVGQAIVGDFPVGHLRLRLERFIHPEQSIEDHVAVVAGDVRRGQDRVDDPQSRVHHRIDRLRLALGGKRHGAKAEQCRAEQGAGHAGGGFHHYCGLHRDTSLRCCC